MGFHDYNVNADGVQYLLLYGMGYGGMRLIVKFIMLQKPMTVA